MDNGIRVKVVYRREKRTFVLRWRDPETGSDRERSAKTICRKEAERLAGELRADLREGRYVEPSKVTWEEFRLRFEAEKLPGLAAKSQSSYRSVLNRVELVLHPQRLSELDAALVSRLQKRLREGGTREATIAMHLRHLKAALRWAHGIGMLVKVPKVEMPKRARKQRRMRGRPINREEYERMLMASKKVRPDDYGIWNNLIQGLWLSGLRLGEGLALSWNSESPFAVDLGGKYPRFAIDAEAEKGFKDRYLPMTPDFATWLMENTPVDDRQGKVFGVARIGMRTDTVSKVVSRIGKAAGVVVNHEQGKFASAHDLRRAFGTRWAGRVKPVELQRLMRHESIETTLGYYVEQDADELAAKLWKEENLDGGPGVTGGGKVNKLRMSTGDRSGDRDGIQGNDQTEWVTSKVKVTYDGIRSKEN